jgi:hypothetical protein
MNTRIYKESELQQIVDMTIELIRKNELDIDDADTIDFIIPELITKLNKRTILLD